MAMTICETEKFLAPILARLIPPHRGAWGISTQET
jgi:hypothetical protein